MEGRIRIPVMLDGDQYDRTVLTRSKKAAKAYRTSSLELRPVFVGVTQIQGDWWRIYNVLGEYQAIDIV